MIKSARKREREKRQRDREIDRQRGKEKKRDKDRENMDYYRKACLYCQGCHCDRDSKVKRDRERQR